MSSGTSGPNAAMRAMPRVALLSGWRAKMTPAVIATMIDEDWKRRSLTSTAKNSRTTYSDVNRAQIVQLGASK
jgi:hypothetical protein